MGTGLSRLSSEYLGLKPVAAKREATVEALAEIAAAKPPAPAATATGQP